MASIIPQSDMKLCNPDDYFIQKKIELMMDMSAKKMAAELANLRSMIDRLNSEMSDMRQQIRESKTRPSEKCSRDYEAPQEAVQTTIKIAPAANNLPNEMPQSRPRYGDYKPEDISITKFFYFGNKK